jgi:FtsP/CotA-like multicopper oxidase with cupredoxin domain
MACVLAGASAMAAETVYNLRADVTTVTMPDGAVITMWGFAQDSAFGVEDGTVTVPGPVLTVPPGDSLKIVLKNNLTPARTGLDIGCPVCIVIPGQPAAMSPVRFGAAPYPQFEGRIRSMTHETMPGNTDPVEYTWPDLKEGTYLYHSGTHIQCHVQMGLYGAVTQDAAPGAAYPGVDYDEDVLLLYSEIDPAFHEAVATGNYGPGKDMTSTIDYQPKYFLINGAPFSDPGAAFPSVSTDSRVLLRFLNAGLQSRVPTLDGHYLSLYAEDGNKYPYPQEQYSVFLPAGKTIDAVLEAGDPERIAVYDRTLALTNGPASPGGMLTYVDVVVEGTISITLQPVAQTVDPGSPASFTVAATGLAPLSYQWQKNSVDILGATDPTYGIPAVALTDAGQYSCVVTNPLGSVSSNSATLTVTHLQLISPNGGESWQPGSTQTVTWDGPGVGPSIKLKLWRNGTFTGYFLTGIEANDGSYAWKIPATLEPGAGYKIQVYTPDYAYSDFSDDSFSLDSAITLTLTSPNGGESWAPGSSHAVTWTGAGVGPSVKLRLWKDGVFTGYYLTGVIANTGSYVWTLPNTLAPGTGYKVQVYTPDYAFSDFSNNDFTVAASTTLTLTSPNGGESWQLGSTQTVTWDGVGAGPSIKLRLWRNGIFTGYFLTGIEANDGSYQWNIPTSLAAGAGYKILVYTPDYVLTDLSDNEFTLTAP